MMKSRRSATDDPGPSSQPRKNVLDVALRAMFFILILAAVVEARVDGEDEGCAGELKNVTRVECMTTAAPQSFIIDVHHDWAPLGAKRFVDLVEDRFFTDVAMFRCVKNFLVQFGISPDPEKKAYWARQGSIQDDPSQGMEFDRRAMMSFAGSGANSRTTQVFITFSALPNLGKPTSPWEVPFGVVSEGMETVVDKLYSGYGDIKPFNSNGIDQRELSKLGNQYLKEHFPLVSYLVGCNVMERESPGSLEAPPREPPVDAPEGDVGASDLILGQGAKSLGAQKATSREADGSGPAAAAPPLGTSRVLFVLFSLAVAVGWLCWSKSEKDPHRTA